MRAYPRGTVAVSLISCLVPLGAEIAYPKYCVNLHLNESFIKSSDHESNVPKIFVPSILDQLFIFSGSALHNFPPSFGGAGLTLNLILSHVNVRGGLNHVRRKVIHHLEFSPRKNKKTKKNGVCGSCRPKFNFGGVKSTYHAAQLATREKREICLLVLFLNTYMLRN